jgi:beta-barrel assembly-enhancing protease
MLPELEKFMSYKVAHWSMILLIAVLLTGISLAGSQDKAAPKKKNSDIDNIGNRDINKGSINLTSIQKEVAMGKQAADQVDHSVRLITDPIVTEYVNRLGQNLVRNSDATHYTFIFKVIDSEEINAFALPGGFLYVNSGLILAADDEAELAAVMAHEIGHVAARHATENMAKAQIAGLATIPLVIFTGGVAGAAAQNLSNIGIPIAMLKYSQKAESEADWLGLQYMYKTGYDPAAAISFFEKLQAKESPRKVSSLFSDHPPTSARMKSEKENIERYLPNKDQYIVSTSEFNAVKARLASIENSKPGQSGGNARGGPTARRGRQGGGASDPGGDNPNGTPNTSASPDDRAPAPDDRPVLHRDDPQ